MQQNEQKSIQFSSSFVQKQLGLSEQQKIISFLQSGQEKSWNGSQNNRLDPCSEGSDSPQSWHFYYEYLNFFSDLLIESHKAEEILSNPQTKKIIHHQLLTKLKQANFLFMNRSLTSNEIQNEIQIKVITESLFFDVIQIVCQLGRFNKKYTVLNSKDLSCRHNNEVIGMGSFSTVYCCKNLNKNNNSAVKCLRYQRDELKNLKTYIKQFFLYDMMSALEIGPKLLKKNRFDFIIFSECLEFQMQKCSPLKYESLSKDLKLGLFEIHLLRIIHSDIKPANIMYSQQFGKNVLLDYGVSSVINQKYGQKTFTLFQGTYEFSGQDMKRIFMKHKAQKIDLYKNDVEMLAKSLNYLNETRPKNINIEKINSSLFNIHGEVIYEFKYHLYINQYQARVSKELQYFWQQFKTVKDQGLQLIISAIKFAHRLEPISLKKLMFLIRWESFEFKSLSFGTYKIKSQKWGLEPNQLDQTLKQQQNSQEDMARFHQIYKILQDNYCKQNDNTIFSKDISQNDYTNLLFILKNETQIDKFSQEQAFFLFIKYCSFWGPRRSIEIDKKQKLASIFVTILQKNRELSQPFENEFRTSEYSPRLNYVNKNFPNLVFMYGYLLSYCMKGQFSFFKESCMTLILKDSIIMEFQYFNFLTQCLTYYYKRQIQKRSKKLISLLIYDFFELNFLVDHHFVLINEQKYNNPRNLCKFCSKKVIDNLIEFFKETIPKDDEYFQKMKVLEIFWGALMKYEGFRHDRNLFFEQKDSDYELIYNEVQDELTYLKVNKTDYISQIAYSYLNSLMAEFENTLPADIYSIRLNSYQIKRKKGFNIIQLSPHQNESSKYQARQSFIQFDKKINCHQLSKMFFISQRFPVLNQQSNADQILSLLDLLINSSGTKPLNYDTIVKTTTRSTYFWMKLNLLNKHQQFKSTYKQKLISLNQSFQKIISQVRWNKTIFRFCLIGWSSYYFIISDLSDYNPKVLNQRNIKFLQSILHQQDQKQSQLLILQTLLLIYPYNSLPYLKTLQRFLKTYLSILQSELVTVHPRGQIIYVNQIKYNSSDLTYGNNRIRTQLYKNEFLFKQTLTFWQNHRIRFNKNQINIIFTRLIFTFIRLKHTKYLVQVISMICQQKNFVQDGLSHFISHYTILLFVASHQQLQNNLLRDVVYQLYSVKTINFSPINYIPLYFFGLMFQKALIINLGLWTVLLTDLYKAFQQLSQKKNLQFQNISGYRQYIYIVSLKYLEAVNPNKRKTNLLFRSMIKCQNTPRNSTCFYIVDYIKKFSNTLIIKNDIVFCLSDNSIKSKISRLEEKIFKLHSQILGESNLVNILKLDCIKLKASQLKQPDILQNNVKSEHFCDVQMMEKYQINDLKFFEQSNIRQDYIRYLREFKQQDSLRLQQIQQRIESVKATEQYHISKQNLFLINKILRLDHQKLSCELEKKKKNNTSSQLIISFQKNTNNTDYLKLGISLFISYFNTV